MANLNHALIVLIMFPNNSELPEILAKCLLRVTRRIENWISGDTGLHNADDIET